MCCILIHNAFLHIRSVALLTLNKKSHRRRQYHYPDMIDDEQDNSNGRIWLSRIATIVFVLLYAMFSVTILMAWNILQLDSLRQFLLFSSDDDNTIKNCRYNLHTYWLFRQSWIRSLHNHHWMNYLYLIFLLLCGIELIRYHILHSYYMTMVQQQQQVLPYQQDDDDNRIIPRSLQESLLPHNWYDDDDNNDITNMQHRHPTTTLDDDQITTTSWRTTTITHWWSWWSSDTTSAAVSTTPTGTIAPRHQYQLLDPIQFQNIQQEWNYRREMDGPYWWSQE